MQFSSCGKVKKSIKSQNGRQSRAIEVREPEYNRAEIVTESKEVLQYFYI